MTVAAAHHRLRRDLPGQPEPRPQLVRDEIEIAAAVAADAGKLETAAQVREARHLTGQRRGHSWDRTS